MVYCDRVERPEQEFRYIGSATAKRGAGVRLGDYERAIRRVRAGSFSPEDEERHPSQIAQPDAICHLRMYSHWNRERISALLVV